MRNKRHTIGKYAFALFCALNLASCVDKSADYASSGPIEVAASQPQPSKSLLSEEVVRVNPATIRHVNGNLFSGGQPTAEEFSALKEKGIKTVINLRSPSETDWDQKALLNSLGIEYINLPIENRAAINADNAEALMNLIDQNNDAPLLVHCGSGNRVGALIATAENTLNNQDVEASIEEGKKWGLKSLEPRVREVLQCTDC